MACINMPENILTNNSINMILRVSLSESFFLNNTRIPSPALEHSPAITEPKPSAPLRYISVIAIETAQFGMSPTIAVITGCNTES